MSTFINHILFLFFQTIRHEFLSQSSPSSESLVKPSALPFGNLAIAAEKRNIKTHDAAEKRNPITLVATGKPTSRPEAEIVLEEK